MALAATGTEAVSAATVQDASSGHYRVQAKLVNGPRASADEADVTLPSVVVANHVLGVIAVSHAIGLPSGNSGESDIRLTVRPDSHGGFRISFVRCEIYPDKSSPRPAFHVQQFNASISQISDRFHSFSLPAYAKPMPIPAYDADGRVIAGIADANERQLLFVKISRG